MLENTVLTLHHRTVRTPRTDRVAAALAGLIGSADSLLDVGSGDGEVAREVARRVGARRVAGVDVKIQPGAAIDVVAYDGRVLPFPDGAFEVVTVADVLHHAADPIGLLREALRVAARMVAVKDHFRFGKVSETILYVMDIVGNAAPGIDVRGRYFSPADWIETVNRAGGRTTALEWPLRIHDLPFRLVTQDRLQFAARVEAAGGAIVTKSFVVGGAGFIGSHIVDRLVDRGPVTVYDDLSVGKRDFIASHLDAGRVTLVQADALDLETLTRSIAGHDVVFHLAANPEARWGLERTRLDLEQGTIVTYNVVEAMRRADVPKLCFASSGTVYGETDKTCAEDDLGSLPISLYGASKFACEALISAFVECFGLRAWIYRFGNVVGPRGTHGAALDFLKKLRDRKTELEVLGDGRQAKPYLFVTDCVDGILFGLDQADARLNIHNLAPPDTTSVTRIAELCVAASPYPNAKIRYTGGDRGWAGDVPRSRMDPGKLAALGFTVRHTSDQAVKMAVEALAGEVFGAG